MMFKRPYKSIGTGTTFISIKGELLPAIEFYLKKIKSGRARANRTQVWVYKCPGNNYYAFAQRMERDKQLEEALSLQLIYGPYMIGG